MTPLRSVPCWTRWTARSPRSPATGRTIRTASTPASPSAIPRRPLSSHRARPPCPARRPRPRRPSELRHAGEDRQHHLAGRRGCIGPRLAPAAQAGAALLPDLRDLPPVARGARKPVEPGDHDDVALPELVEHVRQHGPVARRAGDLLLVDTFAPGLLQRG